MEHRGSPPHIDPAESVVSPTIRPAEDEITPVHSPALELSIVNLHFYLSLPPVAPVHHVQLLQRVHTNAPKVASVGGSRLHLRSLDYSCWLPSGRRRFYLAAWLSSEKAQLPSETSRAIRKFFSTDTLQVAYSLWSKLSNIARYAVNRLVFACGRHLTAFGITIPTLDSSEEPAQGV